MKNLDTFDLFNEDILEPYDYGYKNITEYKVENYIKEDKNFTELDNVKNILQDIYDWYFLNKKEGRPYLTNEIYNLDINGNVHSIYQDINIKNLPGVEPVYFKSFKLYLEVAYEYKKIRENQMKDLVNIACKRLENYGFLVIKNFRGGGYSGEPQYPDIKPTFNIYILGKNDPITLKEILENK